MEGSLSSGNRQVDPVKARGYLIVSGGVPADTEYFTVNGRIYELDTDSTADNGGDVLIDVTGLSTADQFVTAIAAGINGDSSREVDAVADTANDVVWMFARAGGTAGNALTLTENMANTSASAATFSGGTAGGVEQRALIRHALTSAEATRTYLAFGTSMDNVVSVDLWIEDAGVLNKAPNTTITVSGGTVILKTGNSPTWGTGDVLILEIVGFKANAYPTFP